ncbi:origin recognition complex subunit 3 N-terminus-domain-containing protein [Mycena belliarum]|uniref:Origin recognition complex subunit 3 N-terminus-domain-containing protein n=1 Tax=Mycena belliarum TaxID=1033014 RepID=A0AAD6UGJ3_9AGAR|nr:origin recognition complex subunit 3 N-terminus-domain-containing protein [Mycena belliae]
MSIDLEDIQQTVIYIPYDGDEDVDAPEPPLALPSVPIEADLGNGPQMRFEAYKAAWTQCLERVKVIVAELYSPVVSDVMDRLDNVHSDVLPGLPFPELPVLTITDLSSGSLFLEYLGAQLELESDGEDDVAPMIVHHLYPNDCLNITSAMKNLISGFVDRDKVAPRRRPAASVAPYDLGLLQAWYDAIDIPRPSLAVLLHEFEQFDANVVQDMLYICSLQVARLPLTFILSLSTPSPSSYLQASLARATLALLRVYHFAVPSGPEVLHTVLLKTFFDPTVDLLLLPGPALLEFIENHYLTHAPSLGALLTVLQVAHLKHYSTEPLSLLAHATPRLAPSPTPAELHFLEALLARLHSPDPSATKTPLVWSAHAKSVSVLLQAVDAAREEFARHARRTKLGFQLLTLVVAALRGSASDKTLARWTGPAAVSRALDVDSDGIRGIGNLIRKLSTATLDALLGTLHVYLRDLPHEIRTVEAESTARSQIVSYRNPSGELRGEIAEWLEGYLADLLQPLEDSTPLWGVWYTGLTLFPSELINPALRPSVIAGLSVPRAYAGGGNTSDDDDVDDADDLQALPDTSILFAGYVKAGKLINVYDWFDHFRVVLEGQRAAAKTAQGSAKGKAKATPKGKKVTEDEERWKLAVQARFVRALHELDYLGFIKHTSRGGGGGGRKGEYVLRTVLGVLE